MFFTALIALLAVKTIAVLEKQFLFTSRGGTKKTLCTSMKNFSIPFSARENHRTKLHWTAYTRINGAFHTIERSPHQW
jgi:hypothetical protein